MEVFGVHDICWYRHADIPGVFMKLDFKHQTSELDEKYKLMLQLSKHSETTATTIDHVRFAKNKTLDPKFICTKDDVFVFVEGHGKLNLVLRKAHLDENPEFILSTNVPLKALATEYSKPLEPWMRHVDFKDIMDDIWGNVSERPIKFERKTDHGHGVPGSVPNFDGHVYIRGNMGMKWGDYKKGCKKNEINCCSASYQYATSSFTLGRIDPLFTVFVDNDNDIFKAINYARKYGCSIAVRTGGHHYSGASSTSGLNIQLDLSGRLHKAENRHKPQTEKKDYAYSTFEYDHDENVITCGVGLTISELQENLEKLEKCSQKKMGLFVPTGICSDVYLGGHMSTGGLGPMGVPFGLFMDHIYAIEIIMAEKLEPWNVQKIWIPRDTKHPHLADIFYSVMGGSPGNFGIITRVQIKPLKDEHHPNSRGVFRAYFYKHDVFKYVLKRLAECMKTSKTVPPDFSLALLVSGSSPTFEIDLNRIWSENIDEIMEQCHRKLYGNEEFQPHCFDMILLQGVWANLKGKGQKYPPHNYLEEIINTMDKKAHRVWDWVAKIFNWNTFHSLDKPMPLSLMWKNFCYKRFRDYNHPYVKAGSVLSRKYTKTDEWLDLVHAGMDKFLPTDLTSPSTASIVVYPLGPPNCKFRHDHHKGSYSWRSYEEGAVMIDFAMYYKENRWSREYAYKQVPDFLWHHKDWNQRMIWLPSFPWEIRLKTKSPWLCYDTSQSLDKHWRKYFDSEDKYNRIHRTKKKVDPHHVFTPNLWCIGSYDYGMRKLREEKKLHEPDSKSVTETELSVLDCEEPHSKKEKEPYELDANSVTETALSVLVCEEPSSKERLHCCRQM